MKVLVALKAAKAGIGVMHDHVVFQCHRGRISEQLFDEVFQSPPSFPLGRFCSDTLSNLNMPVRQ